jgi:hypothetical protein
METSAVVDGRAETHTRRNRSKTESTMEQIAKMEVLRYPEKKKAIDTLDELFEERPACFGR